MWYQQTRDDIWETLDQPWDLLVVGGGITGAGIVREAARLGLRTLLLEQRDFAWGTSSRSSKLVHGGLRYLKEGRLGLTLASVQERENLLEDGPGLIDPLGFLLASYKDDSVGRFVYQAGLTVYDMLALRWSHRYYDSGDFKMLAPHLAEKGLQGGFRYGDAQTDDARLVLRVIREAVLDGAVALNYAAVEEVVHAKNGRVGGVRIHDVVADRHITVSAQVVVNATGAWADQLRGQVGGEAKIRPLRGSHLIFPAWRFPVAQAVSFLHPFDQRPVMIFPWEGITLVGTTDEDHTQALHEEPGISPEEVAYLMAAVTTQFPRLNLTLDDVISTFAGVRPVIGTGKEDPSDESRDHVVWEEEGLLTVTGGKLTTFRLIALDALKAVRDHLPHMPEPDKDAPVLDAVDIELPADTQLAERNRRRLIGRYAQDALGLIAAAPVEELQPIANTKTLWAELRWGARAEGVVHLEDLLLRRTRIGLLLRHGGIDLLPQIREICQQELGWDDARWQSEASAYEELIRGAYSLPDRMRIPNWHILLNDGARLGGNSAQETSPGRAAWTAGIIGAITVALAVILRLFGKRKVPEGRNEELPN